MIFEGTKNQFFFWLELTRAGTSYPDITLLPALARLLDTDLNTLLSFQEDLSVQRNLHYF